MRGSISKFMMLLLTMPLLFFISVNAQSVEETQPAIDWLNIRKAWDEYVNYPSTEAARKVYEALPKDDVGDLTAEVSATIQHIFKDYRLLAYEMYAGDQFAVKIAFRLLNFTDASYTESTESLLSQLIRIRPRLFLKELNVHKNIKFIREVDYPLFGADPSSIENEKSLMLELELRAKSLDSVLDKELEPIRDECIKRLTEFIKKHRRG